MKKVEPTFTVRKKNPGDINGRVCAFISFTLNKGEHKRVYFTLKDLTTSKPFSIPVTVWDKKNKCCKIKGSVQEKEYYTTINTQIKEIRVAVVQIVGECEAKHCNITSALLSENRIYDKIKHIESFTEMPEPTRDSLLVPYWENFIDRATKGEVLHDAKPYKKTAIISYQKCLNAFYVFEKDMKHHYSFNDITMAFYDSYVGYMTSHGKKLNTIGERIKNLKALMHRAYDEGLHSNLAFRQFTKPEEDVDNVALTEDELRQIFDYQFPPSSMMLEKYRDIFLVGCYTGLRVSDYHKIRKDNFRITANGNTVLEVRTEKTGKEVVIPFIWKELEVRLEKYNYTIPHFSEQKFNQNIKLVCLEAGINTPVVMTSGNHKRDEPYDKWELVSSHTARRSACTNMVLRGIPRTQVMKISGHTKEATFNKYIKISGDENADSIMKRLNENQG